MTKMEKELIEKLERTCQTEARVTLRLIRKLQKEIEDIKEYVNSPEFLDWHLGYKIIDELEYRKNRINEMLKGEDKE